MSKNKPNKKKPAAAKAPPAGAGPMNIDLLQQITALMKENDLNTVDVRDGERRIVLKRGAMYVESAPSYAPSAPRAGAERSAAPAPSATTASVDDDKDLTAIKSPMVGTFYSSPSPDAKVFINVGSVVNADTDVCIIEAMKVFNNIKAETSGVIAKILVNNGQTVEFGQPLFLVRPA